MKKKILVVDDQPGIRLLLTDILQNEGYIVTVGRTGQEAYELLLESNYQLLILDYKLPVLNGLEVIEKMKKANIYTPTIVMSGLVEKFSNEIEVYPQVKQILAKPFDIVEVKQLVYKYTRAS